MASKPVIVEYKDGRQYGVESEAIANRKHPDAKVIGYQDGTALEPSKPAKAPEKADSEKKAS